MPIYLGLFDFFYKQTDVIHVTENRSNPEHFQMPFINTPTKPGAASRTPSLLIQSLIHCYILRTKPSLNS